MFQVGQTVSWTSTSAGIAKRKTGVVQQVVAAEAYPSRKRFPRLFTKQCLGQVRDHESYVILVGTTFYWPRVLHLLRG